MPFPDEKRASQKAKKLAVFFNGSLWLIFKHWLPIDLSRPHLNNLQLCEIQ
nr:MAG TPA: hypothetical protein [Caudoviricetes sp.]